MNLLAQNQSILEDCDWTIYVLPSMNPDGLISGYTKDGPGRLTTSYITGSGNLSYSKGIDMNRSFPTNWVSYTSARNFNGSAPLACRESAAAGRAISPPTPPLLATPPACLNSPRMSIASRATSAVQRGSRIPGLV